MVPRKIHAAEGGTTPRQAVNAIPDHVALCNLAEQVMRKLSSGAAGKCVAQWHQGVWLCESELNSLQLARAPTGGR